MAAKLTALGAAKLADMMPGDRYLSYAAEGVEPIIEDEQGKINKLMATTRRMQERNFSKHRHAMRTTHVKTQAVAKGTLMIHENLPPYLAQGMFRSAKEHPVALRFANEPMWLQDDRTPGPRGVAMKVFDVNGDFLDDQGTRTKTQDFTFNNAPMIELRDLPTCVEIFELRERYFDNTKELKAALMKRKDAAIQLAPTQLPNQHILSYTMYSQSAYRYGDYVVKYGLFPTTKLQQDLASSAKITDSSDPEQHSHWLREYFMQHDAEYDFRVQLLVSLAQQPVEDSSSMWDETAFPFETVGHVTIPKGQDAFNAARRTFWEENVLLNVWYGLKEHRPLGSINRLRKQIYESSCRTREEFNATKVSYISSINEIP